MPRRRLHGETQKRRKKPQTRLLKLHETVVRPQATQMPAPFERSERVEREDLEFLEAMREMEVQRGPWRGEATSRRQAAEQVHFLAEAGEDALFQQGMAHLGVAPLADGGPGGTPRHEVPPLAARSGVPVAVPAAVPAADAAGLRPAGMPVASPSGRSGEVALAPDRPPPSAPVTTAGAAPAAAAAASAAPAERITFEASQDARSLMEALLAEGDLQPELKFAGVGATPRRTAGRAGDRDRGPGPDAEPDQELDLHGKTQEEAIRMVQNFLLVAHRQRMRHVLIITGQGHNSGPGGPVLKEAVYRWLDVNGGRFTRRFERAPSRLGGDGAIWVTLR